MMTAFWAMQHGQACTTTNTAAVCCAAALLTNFTLLAAHTHARRSTLERCLFTGRELEGHDSGDFANHGMDALLRLARNGRLRESMVPDYAWSLLRNNRLDVLPGSDRPYLSDGGDIPLVKEVFQTAARFYDQVLMDVHSGMEMEGTLEVLETADRLFLCLNQNQYLLDACFGEERLSRWIQHAKTRFFLSRYDEDVNLTPATLARRYGIARSRIFVIPHSASLMRACNGGVLYDFVARHMPDPRSPERMLMAALREAVKQLPTGGNE